MKEENFDSEKSITTSNIATDELCIKKANEHNLEDLTCRICWQDINDGRACIRPCKCSGSTGLIHKECLEQWIESSQKNFCEICKYRYKYIRSFEESMRLSRLLSFIGGKILNILYFVFIMFWFHALPIFYAWPIGWLSCKIYGLKTTFENVILYAFLSTMTIIIFLTKIKHIQKYFTERKRRFSVDKKKGGDLLGTSRRTRVTGIIESSRLTTGLVDSSTFTLTTGTALPNHDTFSTTSSHLERLTENLQIIENNVDLNRIHITFEAARFLNEASKFLLRFIKLERTYFNPRNAYEVLCDFTYFTGVFLVLFIVLGCFPMWVSSWMDRFELNNEFILFVKSLKQYKFLVQTIRYGVGLTFFYPIIMLFEIFTKNRPRFAYYLSQFKVFINILVYHVFLESLLPFIYITLAHIWVVKYLNLKIAVGYNESFVGNVYNFIANPLTAITDKGIFQANAIKNNQLFMANNYFNGWPNNKIRIESMYVFNRSTIFGSLFSNSHFIGFINRALVLIFQVYIGQLPLKFMKFFITCIKKLFRQGLFYKVYQTKGFSMKTESKYTKSILHLLFPYLLYIPATLLLMAVTTQAIFYMLGKFGMVFCMNYTGVFFITFFMFNRISAKTSDFVSFINCIIFTPSHCLAKILDLRNYLFSYKRNVKNYNNLYWCPNYNLNYEKDDKKLLNRRTFTAKDVKERFEEPTENKSFMLFYRPSFFKLRMYVFIFIISMLFSVSCCVFIYTGIYIGSRLENSFYCLKSKLIFIDNELNSPYMILNTPGRLNTSILWLLIGIIVLIYCLKTLLLFFKCIKERSLTMLKDALKLIQIYSTTQFIVYVIWPLLLAINTQRVVSILLSDFKIPLITSIKTNLTLCFIACFLMKRLLILIEHIPREITNANIQHVKRVYYATLRSFVSLTISPVFYDVFFGCFFSKGIRLALFTVVTFLPALKLTLPAVFNGVLNCVIRISKGFIDLLYLKEEKLANFEE